MVIPGSETSFWVEVALQCVAKNNRAFASLKLMKVELGTVEEFFRVCAVAEQMISQRNVQSKVF